MDEQGARRLRGLLIWSSVLAIACFGVHIFVNGQMTAAGAETALALQQTNSAARMAEVGESWRTTGTTAWGAFALGFDYLFMLAFGAAFYFGARAARWGWTHDTGLFASVLRIVGVIAILAALFDVTENTLEAVIVFANGPADLAPIAYTATQAKWIAFPIGMAGWLAGLAALIAGRVRA